MKFTRAEDELRITLKDAIKRRRPIHIEAYSSGSDRLIVEFTSNNANPVILLNPLTTEQISKAVHGDLSDWYGTSENESVAENDIINNNNKNTRYNLRRKR